MDVTLAAVRREYATPTSLWLELVVAAGGTLAALEIGRLTASHAGQAAAVGAGLLVMGTALLAARAAGRALRRASLSAELWRKFGLDEQLLQACAALPPLAPEQEADLNRLLSDLRGLAAMANHLENDHPELPDLTELVGLAEKSATRSVRAWEFAGDALTDVASAISSANRALREHLAAARRGGSDPDAAAELREAEAALRRVESDLEG